MFNDIEEKEMPSCKIVCYTLLFSTLFVLSCVALFDYFFLTTVIIGDKTCYTPFDCEDYLLFTIDQCVMGQCVNVYSDMLYSAITYIDNGIFFGDEYVDSRLRTYMLKYIFDIDTLYKDTFAILYFTWVGITRNIDTTDYNDDCTYNVRGNGTIVVECIR